MCHSAVIWWPSGLIVGHNIRMTSPNISSTSSSLRVETRQQVVEQQRRVLGAGELRRVQAAVDVDERLAFTRQPAGLLIGQSFRMRQPARDLAVAVDALEVLLRRHQREVIGPPLRRGAGFDQPHVVRCGVDFLEVVDHLVVGGELVVGARLEAEDGRRRRQPALRGKSNGEQGDAGRRARRACDALAKMIALICALGPRARAQDRPPTGRC